MRHIKIISPGKTRESWLQEALQEYESRLTGSMQLEWILLKKPDQIAEAVKKEKRYYCLDPKGITYTSESFATFVLSHSSISFVIGGPEGIPNDIKSSSNGLISFSSLTFTHQHIRLILVEQLYRALEIDKGSQYHK